MPETSSDLFWLNSISPQHRAISAPAEAAGRNELLGGSLAEGQV